MAAVRRLGLVLLLTPPAWVCTADCLEKTCKTTTTATVAATWYDAEETLTATTGASLLQTRSQTERTAHAAEEEAVHPSETTGKADKAAESTPETSKTEAWVRIAASFISHLFHRQPGPLDGRDQPEGHPMRILGPTGKDKDKAKAEARDESHAEEKKVSLSFTACAAEFIAMTLFVIFGCGSAMSIAKTPGSAWVLQVALSFGLAITVLAYGVGHYSGGQINCAVTFGLVIAGHLNIPQAIANVVAQLIGSVCGALILKVMYPRDKDCTGGLGTNAVAEGWTQSQALIGEIMGTFTLMFTVLETAVNPLSAANRVVACLAIGLSVFLGHSVLIPITGCSINPTRSFGPAVVESVWHAKGEPWRDMWVFWVGPLLGSAMAAGVHSAMAASVASA